MRAHYSHLPGAGSKTDTFTCVSLSSHSCLIFNRCFAFPLRTILFSGHSLYNQYKPSHLPIHSFLSLNDLTSQASAEVWSCQQKQISLLMRLNYATIVAYIYYELPVVSGRLIIYASNGQKSVCVVRYNFTRTWLRDVRVFAIANPSVIWSVRAPYSGRWNFRQHFFVILFSLYTAMSRSGLSSQFLVVSKMSKKTNLWILQNL